MSTSESLHQALAAASQVAQIIIAVVLGALAGWQIDKWCGFETLFILILPGVGFLLSLILVYRAFLKAQQADDEPPNPTT